MRVRPIVFLPVLLVLASVAFLGPARAASPPEPAVFIDQLVAEAVDTLRDKDLSEQARVERLDALLRRGFDIPRIARYVLGRYWTTASDEDRRAFAQLFERWIIQVYGERLSHYTNELVRVTGARPEGETGAVVSSEIAHPGGPPTRVEWRVAKHEDGYKILDIDVAGVSMALTEREEVASVIQQAGGTVAGLNHVLARKLGLETTADSSAR